VASYIVEKMAMQDPICGMRVDERKTNLKSDHEGKTFYFCSSTCKTTFDRDPHKYGHRS
jgi:YHS domain-containing protein